MRWRIVGACVALMVMATPAGAQQRGGIVQVSAASDVDYLDPGRTYYTTGYMIALAQVRPLYGTFPGRAGMQPDLAAGPPQVSADARTVTVPLRRGVRFGPPLNRDVEAKDVKYALERTFSRSVGGQYTFFFDDLVGAPKTPPRTPQPIAGIVVVDPYTIQFQLKSPTGHAFAPALVLPATAPVPEEVAGILDKGSTSSYEEHVVASGPYMVTDHRRGRSITLRRNPNWDPATDPRPAYLDGVDYKANDLNPDAAGTKVATGSHLLMEANVPSTVYRRYVRSRRAQFAVVPSGGVRYMSLNTTVKAFRDINVRRAVVAGFDKTRLRAARGGAWVGAVATHFIPPGVPGHEEAGGARGPLPKLYAPKGNRSLMRQYFRKAGYPKGRYTGKEALLLVTSNVDPGRAQGREAARQLRTMGFRVKVREVFQDAVYSVFCQRPSANVAMCGSAGWFKDFDDGVGFLRPLFDSRLISRSANNNLAELRDPKVDALFDSGNLAAGGPARAAAAGALDRRIAADAPAVPFLWDTTTLLRSSDMAAVPNPYYSDWDLSFSGFR